MTIPVPIKADILPILAASLADGFRAFVLRPGPVYMGPAGFAYICRDIEGPFAVVNGSCNALEPPTLAAPIRPDRRYGTGVLADFDGTVADAVSTLRRICETPMVSVRFVTPPALTPNLGRRVFEGFPYNEANFVELTAGMLDAAAADAAARRASRKLSHV